MSRRVHGSWAVLGSLLASGSPLGRLLGCGSALFLLLACGSPDAGGPTETLSRFLETMDRSNHNEGARKEAYAMLDETTQQALAERARRAALVSGRDFSPWDMLAPGRFRLRFAPAEHGGMRATVTGEHALVQVVSGDGKDKVSVPLIRQAGSWRVQLAVPPARRDRERTSLPRDAPALFGLREQAPVGSVRDGQAGLPSIPKPPAQKP